MDTTAKCSNNWIKRFFCKPEQWKQIEQGPITINDFRYEIIPIKIEGTYIREQNQKGEDRYIIIGLSNQGRLLFVSHTDRNNRIRLISARLLTPKEKRYYEQ